MIDKKSRVPLYAQLIDIIVGKIELGELKENEKLPSERELCDLYNISRTTTRQAMIELENDGYIYKEHGKGSFVSPRTYTQSLVKMYSFSEEIKKLGKTPKTSIIALTTIPASLKVAKKLEIVEEDMVYELIRLRLADEDPMLYEITYIPYWDFPDLTKEDFEKQTMYGLFQSRFGISIQTAKESFKAVKTGPVEAKYLLDEVGAPAMRIERIAYSHNHPVEYTRTVARGDKYVYTIELS